MAEMVFDQAAQNGFVGFALAPGMRTVPGFDIAGLSLFIVRRHGFELDHGRVAAFAKYLVRVPHIGDAAGHAGREVAPGFAPHDHRAAGHVFAAVVARALSHGPGSGLSDRAAFARPAGALGFPGPRSAPSRIAT